MDTIRISGITWNVETTWPEQDLHALLGLREREKLLSDSLTLPDIFLVCLQEVRSQPQNVIMDTLFEEPWTTAFREVLGNFGYVRVSGERLQGIVTSIFVLRHHLPHLRDIHTVVTRTGLGGYWGNKGAVCIRFTIYGCSLCVVNAHLAAHDSGFSERCLNYNTIIDETSFPVNPTSSILFHDYVFWLGDLNYRLDGEDSAEFISKKVTGKELSSLLQKDQLKKAQVRGQAFEQLVEGEIKFPPTYKYKRNSEEYDLSRRPAWTDRILHQVHIDAYENIKLGVDQSLYGAKQEYGQSDHKPVIANYSIKVFAHHHERCVTFKPFKEWVIGGIHKIKYTLDSDITTSPWDYIAMFKASFTSVNQYVTYTYVPQTLTPSTHTADLSPARGEASKNESGVPRSRNFELRLNDELVQIPGLYVLLYYSAKYTSYLGMSDPFPVIEKSQ